MPKTFTDQYIDVRSREGRLYSDDEVRSLPDIVNNHAYADEWHARSATLAWIVRHYAARAPTHILDVGCGNGWASQRMATALHTAVTGIDINHVELDQAKRVFGDIPQLDFQLLDPAADTLPIGPFDLITILSAIQYFAKPRELLQRLLPLLNPSGHILIADSPIYTNQGAAKAKDRSEAYYRQLGCETFAHQYHHHLWSDFAGYEMEIRHDPRSTWHRIRSRFWRGHRILFPIVCVHGSRN